VAVQKFPLSLHRVWREFLNLSHTSHNYYF
jgi:hypothetical protein